MYGEIGVKALAVPVYQMTLKVDPAMLGLMLALPRLWDAVTDPLMGYISDRTRSRFGRRRPYIVVGALLSAVSFALIWMVPTGWSQQAQLSWFLVTALLFYTCLTVWGVPYQSLGYEITADYHERTSVMGVRAVFAKLASFTNQWMFPLAHLAMFASVMEGVRVVTLVVAAVVFAGLGLLPGLVRERFAEPPVKAGTPPPRFWATCRAIARNRSMLVLTALTLLQVVAGMLASSLDYYILVYHMFDGDVGQGAIWKGVLSSSYALVGFAAIWPVTVISRRFDKRRALAVIYGLAVVGGALKWVLFTPGMPWLIVLDPLCSAALWTAVAMIMPSMAADICDEDEWKHGVRREGMFGAALSWFNKTAVSLSFLGSGVALNLVGFDAARGGDQAPEAILGMRLVLVFGTVIPALLALVVLRFYPLNAQRAAEIRADLEARRGVR